jgi:hypothetical protein
MRYIQLPARGLDMECLQDQRASLNWLLKHSFLLQWHKHIGDQLGFSDHFCFFAGFSEEAQPFAFRTPTAIRAIRLLQGMAEARAGF